MKHIFSLKRTLFSALPCLALSLFAVSCSDDDSALVTDKATKGKTLSFTATAPDVTEYATRIGFDEYNLTATGDEREIVIWHEGEEAAFNFIEYGESVGNVYAFTVSPKSNPAEAVFTPVPVLNSETNEYEELTVPDGLYEVHVVSPGLEPGVKTFTGDDVAATTIDLRGQYQPAITNNYKNLGDYHYQYAYTLAKVEDGVVVQGSGLRFTALTSLIRYRITNNLGVQLHVAKINVSYDEISQSPFYTRGTFDPLTAIAIQPVGEPVSTLGLRTDKTLAQGGQFNAFLSLIPTAANNPSAAITYTVFFYKDGDSQLYKKVWNVTAANLANGNLTAGGRWLQGLTLQGTYETANPSELADEEEGPITPPVIQPESVTITSPSITNEIAIGEELALRAYVNPAGATGTIVWSSSNPAVASVTQTGVVTGVSNGEATITASVGETEIKSTLSVKVGIVGVGSETINGLPYQTYTYSPRAGASITWMMTNYDYNSTNNGYSPYTQNCPLNWFAPSSSQISDLLTHFVDYPIIPQLFKNAIVGPDRYLNNSPLSHDNTDDIIYLVITSNELSTLGSSRYVMSGIVFANSRSPVVSAYNYYNFWIGDWGSRHEQNIAFPVRCVKHS